MKQEEKAKAYDKVREKIAVRFGTNAAEEIFSEFEESEDESIREYLIRYIDNTMKSSELKSKLIAWLEKQGQKPILDFKAKDWYVSKVDGKIYNAKFMEKTTTNLARKLEIEKAAMSATGIIEREEWFIKGAEWSDKNPSYISSEKQGEQKPNDKLAWSEGDDVLLSSVINSLLIFEDSGASKMKIDWLKSIKQRIKKEAV